MRFTRNFDYSNGKIRTIYLLLPLLWVAVIFSFSLQPAATSSQVSRGVGHFPFVMLDGVGALCGIAVLMGVRKILKRISV